MHAILNYWRSVFAKRNLRNLSLNETLPSRVLCLRFLNFHSGLEFHLTWRSALDRKRILPSRLIVLSQSNSKNYIKL